MEAVPHSPSLRRTPRPVVLAWPKRAAMLLAQAGLIVLMAVGSLAVWIGSPLAWLWLVSQEADWPDPGMGPYIVLFAGVIVTSVVLGRILAALDRAYRSLRHDPIRRRHHAFLRASGQERLERATSGPLGIVMTISVIAAMSALVVWLLITGHPFVPIPF